MRFSETHLLASPSLEMPFEVRNGKVHGSLLIPLDPGHKVVLCRYNEAGQPRPVIETVRGEDYNKDGENTFIVRHQGVHGLPPAPPQLRLPASHNLRQRNIRLAENFEEDHTNKVFLGPSLYDETLYGPNRDVQRHDSHYGFIRPYRLAPDQASYLQVVMPELPYGNIGMIAVNVLVPEGIS
jgi:hypothetical protein